MAVLVLVLSLVCIPAFRAQFTYQVLIEPTVDPSSVLGSVGTLSGPTFGRFREGFSDGLPEFARFRSPAGIAVGADGIAYVADALNHAIRRIDSGGGVRTIAGGDGPGFVDGVGRAARLFNPHGVAVGPDGEVYVADTSNDAIRHISPTGVVSTLFHGRGYASAEPRQVLAEAVAAATSPPPASYTYDEASPAASTSGMLSSTGPSGLWNPQGIAVWPGDGGNGVRGVLIADTDNHRVLMLAPGEDGNWSLSLFAGRGTAGFVDGSGASAAFNYPASVSLCAVDSSYQVDTGGVDTGGNASSSMYVYHLLVADSTNHAVRVVTEGTDGSTLVHTLAGNGAPGDDDSRTKREKPRASLLITSQLPATFAFPTGVACDGGYGGAVVADSINHRIRQVRHDGVTITVAGHSAVGHSDGPGRSASFNRPVGIAQDARRDRYLVVDEANAAVRTVSLRSEALISAASPSARLAGRSLGAWARTRPRMEAPLPSLRGGHGVTSDHSPLILALSVALFGAMVLRSNREGHASLKGR